MKETSRAGRETSQLSAMLSSWWLFTGYLAERIPLTLSLFQFQGKALCVGQNNETEQGYK
jgi:hypothetical protein